MKYRFLNKDGEHLHQLWIENEWKNLTGTSSVVNVLAKPLTWWASGLACEKFGWLNPKKNPQEIVRQALQEGWERVKGLSLEAYEKLLGEAYKAHSVNLKDSAEKGTDLHFELEHWV